MLSSEPSTNQSLVLFDPGHTWSVDTSVDGDRFATCMETLAYGTVLDTP